MSTPAVTVEAPAVSQPSDKRAEFLPTDKHYRMTGEMPAVKDEASAASGSNETDTEIEVKATPSQKADASAASDSDTAAASEAAKAAEEKGPAQSKSPQTGESRWQKLSRENKELNARLARLETTPPVRDDKQTSQPAADKSAADAKGKALAKPKIDDVDAKTGKAKYANYSEYEDAKDGWLQDEAVRKFQETSAKTAKAEQLTQAEQIIERTVNERVAAVRKSHPNYDTVIKAALAQKDEHGQDALFYTKGSHIDGFFLDSDRGHDVLNEIGEHFDAHKHIFARDAQGRYLLNAVRQVRELAKIENSLPATASDKAAADKAASDKAKTSSARPISQAPPPAHQTSGKGTVGKDAVEQAIEDDDQETYNREQNARQLARLKKGK